MATLNFDSVQTRLSLLNRLRHWNNDSSWNEFFQIYWKLIYSSALRAGLDEQDAQDVVQDTVIAVATKMPDFIYKEGGSFKGWLLTITRWKIADRIRKKCRQKQLLSNFEHLQEGQLSGDPFFGSEKDKTILEMWDEEWGRNLIDAALEKTKQKVEPRDFQVFDLYFLKETPVKVIAEGLKISTAQVHVINYRVKNVYAKILKTLERNTK